MTAKNVTNNHTGALRVGGVMINPGATARVENWERVESSNAVATWIANEILTVSDAKAAPAAFPPATKGGNAAASAAFPPAAKSGAGFGKNLADDPDGEAKDVLIARLKELSGVEKTRASGLESLRKQVEEAEKKAKE